MMLRRKCGVAISLLAMVLVLVGSLLYYNMVQAQVIWEYDPWCDINDDGKISIRDIADVASRFGTSGDPLTKAAILYDSGWVNITDKCGQYFNITHNLNSTDVIVDVTGKTTINGGVHQKYIGLTSYTPGWSRIYEIPPAAECAKSVVQTSYGGYVIAGFLGDNLWLVKTDTCGNMQWERSYGGGDVDGAYSVVQTIDGGYALAGYTESFGAGNGDFWLVKTDAYGNMEWSRTYGWSGREWACSVVQTDDGGYVLAGGTNSFGAGFDFCLVKANASGNMGWARPYGGTNDDNAECMVETNDGGYAIAGYTESFGAGYRDFWLVKVDSSGNQQWSKTYGGTDHDWACSAVQASDGGYALAGWTNSSGAGHNDFWLVKTDANGNMQWNKTYGGSDDDRAYSVVETIDSGYAIAGSTQSFGAGGCDFWVIKTDAKGNMKWNKTYGGARYDAAYCMIQTNDGGYVVAGDTDFFGGFTDVWLIKTDVESGLAWMDSTADTLTLYRGATDPYWNYVRVRIWKIKETP